jgi:hypothetical protein
MFVSFAEKSLDAPSYRSEVLGAIAAQLILRAATRNVPSQYQEVPTYCDNKGVLNHGSQAEKELREKQAQFDVLHVMKTLIAKSPVKSAFQWAEAHSVEKKGLRHCTHPEIMNDLLDRLADVAHHRSSQLQNFIESDFPFEKLRLKHNGKKVTGNLCREMDNLTEERNALKYFAESDRISRENFQTVWWDGMENLMKSYPKMYRVWLTKHVSGCCGTNKHMSYWNPGWSAKYVSFMRECSRKNVTCDTVQRTREKEDAAQFSWGTGRLDV